MAHILLDPTGKLFNFPTISGESITIGREQSSIFQPDIGLGCFRGLGKLTLRPQLSGVFSPVLKENSLLLSCVNLDIEAKLTPINGLFNQRGGLDVVILLKTEPQNNKISFGYDTTLLIPHIQPELTTQEKTEGCQRPDYAINSIAWYHANKGGWVTNEDKANRITTGKAYHQYRMKATDALGKTIWTDWEISAGNLISLVIDKTFLNKATYPVVIAPIGDTFGDTVAGSGGSSVASWGPYRATETMGLVAGTGNSITAWLKNAAGQLCKLAVYTGANVLANGVTNEITLGTYGAVLTEETANFSVAPSLEASTAYGLACAVSGEAATPYFAFDSTGGVHAYDTTAYASCFPDPWSSDGSGTRRYSIYCTYTPTGGGGWSGEFCGVAVAEFDGVTPAEVDGV